jgi:hypothetical protein
VDGRLANEGLYCVTAPGIDAASVPAAVSVDFSSTADPDGNASVTIGPAGGCSGGAFLVITYRQPIVQIPSEVAGNAIEANNVGFTIVIP